MKPILGGILTLVLGCTTAFADGQLHLFRDGSPRAVIVSAQPAHAAAAATLQEYIEKSTGVKLEIVDVEPTGAQSPRVPIRLGGLDLLPDGVDAESLDREGFVLLADDRGLTIAGRTAWGVEYGVYEVLEQYFGVRWLLPGADGEHVPQIRTVTIDIPLQRRVEPSFLSRMISPWNPDGSTHGLSSPAYDLWARRMRQRGRVSFHHYLHRIFPLEEYTDQEKYPGWLSTTNSNAGVHRWQPNFAEPGTITVAIEHINSTFESNPNVQSFSLGVNDSGGFTEHPDYTELNHAGYVNYSDLYYAWANKVAEGVAEKFPDHTLGCMAYREVTTPPTFDLHPMIVPFVAVESYTLVDPEAWDNVMPMYSEWGDRTAQFGIYDYLYGTMYMLPRLGLDHLARVYAAIHDRGVRHIYTEAYENWASGPKMYVYSKLLWDKDLDIDATFADWYRHAVGEEAAPYLAQYFAIWDRFWLETVPGEKGWFNKHVVYLGYSEPQYLAYVDPQDIAESRRLLDRAVKHAQTPDQRARAEMIRKGWDYFEASALAYHSDWVEFDLRRESPDDAMARLDDAAEALAQAERRQGLIDEHLQDKRIALSVDVRTAYKLLEGTAWGQEGFWSLHHYVQRDEALRGRLRTLAKDAESSYVRLNAAALLAATAPDAEPLNLNTDFESGDAGWMVIGRQEGTVAERTDRAAFDSGYGYALRGMDRGGIVQDVDVSEPGVYAVTAMVRSVGEDGTGGQGWGLIEIALTGMDAAGKSIASDFYITKAVKPGWRRLATILDLSQATDLVRVQAAVTVAGLPGVREVQVDDLEVYRVGP